MTCLFPIILYDPSGWTLPHRGQTPSGLCSITLSGLGDINSVSPLWPGCPPGFLPLFSRRLWFLSRKRSWDGGRELLPLFLGVLRLFTSDWSTRTCAVSASTLIRRSYTKSTNCSLLSFLNSSLVTILPSLCSKVVTIDTVAKLFGLSLQTLNGKLSTMVNHNNKFQD